MKQCTHCHETKPLFEFSPIACRNGAPNAWCKECCKKSANSWYYKNRSRAIEKRKEWGHKNKSLINEINRNYINRRRDEVLIALGGMCSCCGESHRSMLDIDHVHGGGNKHRKALRHKGAAFFYSEVVKDIESGGGMFQILCCNCNHSKRRLGRCEHECLKLASIQS